MKLDEGCIGALNIHIVGQLVRCEYRQYGALVLLRGKQLKKFPATQLNAQDALKLLRIIIGIRAKFEKQPPPTTMSATCNVYNKRAGVFMMTAYGILSGRFKK